MVKINLIKILFILIPQIILCQDKLDIKLSIGKKKDGLYPIIMTLKDEEINQINTKGFFIHLFCFLVFNNPKDDTKKQNLLNFLSKLLTEKDTLTLIEFKNNNYYIFDYKISKNKTLELKTIDEGNNNSKIKKVNFMNFKTMIDSLYKALSKINRTEEKIIFAIDDREVDIFKEDYQQEKSIIIKSINSPLYLFSFKCNRYQENLLKYFFIDEVEFFIIPQNHPAKYITNTFKNIRNVKYLSNNISIITNYSINNISIKNKNFQKDNFTFSKLHLIPGKEYTYFFNLNLTDVRNGEIILTAKIDYINLITNKEGSSSKKLKYYNSLNYFDFNKKEYCRIILSNEIKNNILKNINSCINGINYNSFVSIFNKDFVDKIEKNNTNREINDCLNIINNTNY